jgi:hypothetical protein
MTDSAVDNLSTKEKELLVDFVEWVGEFDRQVLERQTIEGNSEEVNMQEMVEFLAPLVSEDTTESDAQMLRLFRLDRQIRANPVFEYEHEDELPSDAVVTPDELNRFLKKDELEEFFTISSQMIEALSIELVMEEVVAESRESNSVRQKVTRMSQKEREWLLHVTGIISEGQKGEIRRVYDLRSSIVHASDSSGDFLTEVNIPSDIDRAKSAINSLHEELHGIELKHRFGDLIA